MINPTTSRTAGTAEDRGAGLIADPSSSEQYLRTLEQSVAMRTAQLEAANRELEAFAYSVSHDLKAPLRGIDGWSLALMEDYGPKLDEPARQYLGMIRSEAQRMGRLIDDLLQLSRVTRRPLSIETMQISAIAETVVQRLMQAEPHRHIEFVIAPHLAASGDPHLIELALTSLLENAMKYTGTRDRARIEFGRETAGDTPFYVKDNGVGFDMAHLSKLFTPFQRLHPSSEFPGAGVGLATVQRIIHRLGGRVWAHAEPNGGAVFYFTLPPAA